MRLTFISDTHTKHHQLTNDLVGGDLIIHAGDSTSRGYEFEIKNFIEWFSGLDNYTHKIFIAGNHDWGFQTNPNMCNDLLKLNNNVTYLEDNLEIIGTDYESSIKVWGSPWQPTFYNWAFNLPRNGEELKEKWDLIPNDIDILITHGPPHGILDVSSYGGVNVGCELLMESVMVKKPKIHIFGHIHSDFGYKYHNGIHFINASMLDDRYEYIRNPITFDWNPKTNKLDFI